MLLSSKLAQLARTFEDEIPQRQGGLPVTLVLADRDLRSSVSVCLGTATRGPKLTLYDWLVRADFVLAVLLTVLAPLGLLLWSALRGREVIVRQLVTYWRVSSLLMVTVYLLAAAAPIGFLTGVLARVLIPLSLGFGWLKDKGEGRLETTFYRWKQVVSLYCLVGVLFNLPLLRCTFTWQIQPPCTAWLGPVREFVGLVHPGVSLDVLGVLAWIALGIYIVVFVTLYARDTNAT